MNSKLKYMFFIFVFLIVTFIVIYFPRFYFDFYDKSISNKVVKNKLNLSNIYDNYNLSNKKKIDILRSNYMSVSSNESLNPLEVEEVLKTFLDNVLEIDVDIYNVLKDDIPFLNENKSFFSEKGFITSEDFNDSLVLRKVNYSTDNFYVGFLMDIYDNTILNLEIESFSGKRIFANLDSLKLKEEFSRYLDVNINDVNVLINSEYGLFDSDKENIDSLRLFINNELEMMEKGIISYD